ncbi:hypothetical protein, partial [Polaromonas sp.]|uniref:hypothetical protein n=1 Tax=Polaromonas sp. TaxID=1869339 RepID=UPI003CBC0210
MSLFSSPLCLSHRLAFRLGQGVYRRKLLAFALAVCCFGAGLPVLGQEGKDPAAPWLGRQGAALVLIDASGSQTLEQ